MNGALEFRKLQPAFVPELSALFSDIAANGDDVGFSPHPFTIQEAKRLCAHNGQDLFYIALNEQCVIGYGMLRGWDEGFTVPSLGIFIRRNARRLGLGTAFMHFLHVAARSRGATRIRLKVIRIT